MARETHVTGQAYFLVVHRQLNLKFPFFHVLPAIEFQNVDVTLDAKKGLVGASAHFRLNPPKEGNSPNTLHPDFDIEDSPTERTIYKSGETVIVYMSNKQQNKSEGFILDGESLVAKARSGKGFLSIERVDSTSY